MNYAVLLSGGRGKRLKSDVPKQYIIVNGKMIITYSLETLISSEYIDKIIIVAEDEWTCEIIDNLNDNNICVDKIMGFAKPGSNRQMSIINGMKKIMDSKPDNDSSVMIHDAARPFLNNSIIRKCYDALKGHDGVMPVLPMKDTVYYSEDGNVVSELLDREKIYAGQAPELFALEKYYNANVSLSNEMILNVNGSTEPAIMAGMDIAMIPGDENNYKITTQSDLERFYNSYKV